MKRDDHRGGHRLVRWTGLGLAATIFGVGTAIGVAALATVRQPAAVVGGRETIRFPETTRCGIVAWRRDGAGAIDVTIQTGMIMRMGGDYDAEPGAVEKLVPSWARDHVVPWGWDGPWQPGLRSVRHIVLRGWPWPMCYAVLQAQGDSPDGPGGWTVIEGTLRGRAATSPWDPVMPTAWPTVPHWPGAIANAAFFAMVWGLVGLAAFALRDSIRSSWRRRRGRCAHCGHPFGASEPSGCCCPECGQLLVRRRSDE